MEKHLELLGYKVRDVVSGFEGIVTSISFDLFGCVQAVVRPELDKKKRTDIIPEGLYLDIKRLKRISQRPVMTQPNFALPEIGGDEKPRMISQPIVALKPPVKVEG